MNLPHNLTNAENLKAVEMMYTELMKRFDQGNKLPLLDPIEDMEIEDKELKEYLKVKGKLTAELEKIDKTHQITELQKA